MLATIMLSRARETHGAAADGLGLRDVDRSYARVLKPGLFRGEAHDRDRLRGLQIQAQAGAQRGHVAAAPGLDNA